MKNYKIILIMLLGLLFVNSCATDDLEQVNPNVLSPDTFFSNEIQVQQAVNAAYANLQTFSLYGRLLFYMMDNMSHEQDGNPQQEADKVTFANFDFNSTNQQILDYWDSCYRGVNKANFVIGNSDLIFEIPEGQLTTVKKNKFIAEARFLRAHYYWLLVNRFGGIPLPLSDAVDPAGLPKSSKQEVINAIIDDLTFAAANLLPKASADEGRANKGAAQAFLGKVLLYQESYGPALASFNAMSGYALETEYYDNFKEETEHGIESVFEVQYDKALGTGDKWATPVGGQGANNATFRGQDYGNLNWFNVYPNDDLLSSFEPGDKRYAGSFYSVGDTYNNGANVMLDENFVAGGFQTPAAWKKYQNYYKQTSESEESGINVKVIRFADVILMKAECLNNVSSPAAAVAEINKVRARAGVPALATTLSQQQVFQAIIKERKTELAGEQVRFDDMLRWGIAATELAGTGFQSGKSELWPIPDKEFTTNDNMDTSEQNPGY